MRHVRGTSSHLRHGFTLVETVLSLAVVSILLGAMGSLVVVASKSLPDRGRATTDVRTAAGGLERLSAELGYAVTLVDATRKYAEFTVADRNGDGAPETVRYEWTGKVGDPLTRQYNGGTPSVVVPSVQAFTLDFTVVSTSSSLPSTTGSVPESLLASASPVLVLLSQTADSSKPFGQAFIPTLGATARSWKVTRARFPSSRVAGGGITSVQLRTTDGLGQPTSTILASTQVAQAALPASQSTTDVVFTDCPPLAPGQEIVLVFECVSGCPSIRVGEATLSLAAGEPLWTFSSGSWSSSTLKVIPFEIYGTASTDVPASAATKRLTAATITLRAGNAQQMRVAVRIPNEPEVK